MKMRMTLSVLAIGLGAATLAQAQSPVPVNPVYLAGSTAFRSQVYQGLLDIGLSPQAGDASTANTFTFTGTVNAALVNAGSCLGTALPAALVGSQMTVYCSFDGSAQGCQDLTTANANSYENIGGSGASPRYFTHATDLAFSDVFQTATFFAPPVYSSLKEFNAPDAGAAFYGPGTGIAVQPFLWAANSTAAAAGVTYIKHDQIEYLMANGSAPLAFWTGQDSDKSTTVYLTGRDNGSGTRITAEDVDNYPTSSLLLQNTINGATGDPATIAAGGSFAAIAPSAAGPVIAGGYSSGGKVCDALAYPAAAPANLAVGYLSFADAKNLPYPSALVAAALPTVWTTVPNAGLLLPYDGINPVSALPASPGPIVYNIGDVEYGQYPFWAYEHLYENATTVAGGFVDSEAGPALALSTWYEISLQGVSKFPQTAVIFSDMYVNRGSTVGGNLIPNY
jgi:hypothetical protein